MRKLVTVVGIVVVMLVGFYAARVGSAARAPVATAEVTAAAASLQSQPAPSPPAAPFPKRVASAPGHDFDPLGKYPPGTYVPRGFMPDFRQRIVSDFGKLIDERLGKDFPVEKRQAIAAAQNALWDTHGPNADLFRSGRISQQEFAERTHDAFGAYVEQLGKVFSDDEYEKMLNLKKGEDPYAALFHSSGEQPGLRFQNSANPTAENEPRAEKPGPSQPPTPHASAVDYSSGQPQAAAPGASKYAHN